MSWISKLVGGGVTEAAGSVGTLAKDIADVFTTSDREALDQYRAETDRLVVERAGERQVLGILKAEAEHPSLFVAGARPAMLWVVAIGALYHFLLYPLVGPFIKKFGGVELYTVDWQELSGLALMLGIGAGLRTYEKVKGVARERIGSKK